MSDKKTSLFVILKILQKYTDENHALNQQAIIDLIKQDYGLSFERKSIATNIAVLNELGYEIEKTHGGYVLLTRLFDQFQARYLNDALFSSKAITGEQAMELSETINSELSVYQNKSYTYLNKSCQISRTNNSEVLLNVEIIGEAIENKKIITFEYLTYDDSGNKVARMNGYRYRVSPYYLINNFGRYYLICHYRDKYGPIHTFRVDYIQNIQIDESIEYKPLESFEGMENFDITEYINNHIYMYGDNIVNAKIEVFDSSSILYIDDWFGSNSKIYKENNKLYANVTCSEDALFFWALQYGNAIKLVEPIELVERIKNHLKKEIEKYK